MTNPDIIDAAWSNLAVLDPAVKKLGWYDEQSPKDCLMRIENNGTTIVLLRNFYTKEQKDFMFFALRDDAVRPKNWTPQKKLREQLEEKLAELKPHMQIIEGNNSTNFLILNH